MNITEYADREMLAISVANILVGELKKSLLVQEHVSFSVCGGTTPAPIFDLLSAADLDWNRVHIMPSDERWVDEDNAASNGRLIKKHLITDKAKDARFVPFFRAGLSAADGAAEISATLSQELPISVLMLGMGTDMHTASLFPGAAGVEAAMAADAPHLNAVQPAGQDIARVSLSAAALNRALSKHLIIFGDDKRAALERAVTLPPQDAPVAAVLTGAQIHWAA